MYHCVPISHWYRRVIDAAFSALGNLRGPTRLHSLVKHPSGPLQNGEIAGRFVKREGKRRFVRVPTFFLTRGVHSRCGSPEARVAGGNEADPHADTASRLYTGALARLLNIRSAAGFLAICKARLAKVNAPCNVGALEVLYFALFRVRLLRTVDF